jgi:phenylacetate-CoA ligase
MTDFYDELETRSPEARTVALMAALARQVAHARAHAPAFAASLADIDAAAVAGMEALAKLPVLRKAELTECQGKSPPFGGLAAVEPGRLTRVFQSPGPIYEPESGRPDYWRFARALHAAGFRRGDIIHNCFSYHFTPAGSMVDTGAHLLGCGVFPAGPGQLELQVRAIADIRPAGYVGTPSFLKMILDKAAETGADTASLHCALVSGEALPGSLRDEFAERGVAALQCYATADLGLIAYESSAREGLIVEEGVIVEIVRPGTGDPVPEGEVGEVLVTTLNPDYPLIRFATGDLSAVLPGTSPCGRTNQRIRGWMGRADQTTKVRGMFVHPSQVAAVAGRHPEIGRFRLVVDRVKHNDIMTLRCEAGERPEGLAEAVAASVRELCRLRGEVELVDPGTLPNDGKVIDDIRTYE